MEFSGSDGDGIVVIGEEGDEGQVIVDSLDSLLPKSFKLNEK